MEKTRTMLPTVNREAETEVVDGAQRGTAARFVKIRFPDKPSRVAGVYRLMRQTRVVCLPNDEYVIARAGLAILNGGDVPYEVLEETSLDESLAALRDSAAPLL